MKETEIQTVEDLRKYLGVLTREWEIQYGDEWRTASPFEVMRGKNNSAVRKKKTGEGPL